jgi:hypothetical protein
LLAVVVTGRRSRRIQISKQRSPPTKRRYSRSEAAATGAHRILQLCLGDSAPFGLIDFLTGAFGRNSD